MGSERVTWGSLKGPAVGGGGLLALWLGLMAIPKCERSEAPPPLVAQAEPATATRAEYVKQVEPADSEPVVPTTLVGLLAKTQAAFSDTENTIDRVGIVFALAWAQKRYPWSELAALPETSFGKLKKDPSVERGKRLCASGTIAEITDATSGGTVGDLPPRSLYGGKLVTEAGNVVTFYAVGSTGAIVESSYARFCGIATGLYSYQNAMGGTTHSVLASGMFDLPENRKAPGAPMPKR